MVLQRFASRIRFGQVLMAAGLGGIVALPAAAQMSPFLDAGNPSVRVDYSVLGPGYDEFGAPVNGGGPRLMPSTEMPTSRLHVAPPRATNLPANRVPAATQSAASARQPATRATPAPVVPATAVAPTPSLRPPAAPTLVAPPAPVSAAPSRAPAAAPTVAPPPAPAATAPLAAVPTVAAPTPPTPPVAVPASAPPPPAVVASAASPPAASRPQAISPPAVAPQTAARSPAATARTAPGAPLSVVFDGESTNLPPTAADGLRDLAARLKGQEEMRVQLMAYAGGDDMQASKARRLSLSRALAVRTYLIENGVRSTRIDVRALGNKTTEEPLNRVDVVPADR